MVTLLGAALAARFGSSTQVGGPTFASAILVDHR